MCSGDIVIFQYNYNSPFGPQNYGPHFTHTSALTVRVLPVDGPQVRTSAFYTWPINIYRHFQHKLADITRLKHNTSKKLSEWERTFDELLQLLWSAHIMVPAFGFAANISHVSVCITISN